MRSQNPQCFKGFLASNNKFHAFFRYHYTSDPEAQGGQAWGSLLKTPMSGADTSVEVQMETLDALLGDVEKMSLIKVDTEGSEWDVLKGGEGIIDRTKPVITFEVNLTKWADMEASVSSMFQWLDGKGYNLYLPQNGHLVGLKWLNSRIMNIFGIHRSRKDCFTGRGLWG